jgi:hypothetical protein
MKIERMASEMRTIAVEPMSSSLVDHETFCISNFTSLRKLVNLFAITLKNQPLHLLPQLHLLLISSPQTQLAGQEGFGHPAAIGGLLTSQFSVGQRPLPSFGRRKPRINPTLNLERFREAKLASNPC